MQDNGLGIDLTQGEERLFAMFQRLHTHVEGTGMSLYMVKKMVKNAGDGSRWRANLARAPPFACILGASVGGETTCLGLGDVSAQRNDYSGDFK